MLPIDSFYNGNNGHGDISVNNRNMDIKSISTYKDSNAPTVAEENAINLDIKADFTECVLNHIFKIADEYPEIINEISNAFHNNISFMINPYKGFYRASTFVDTKTGARKVYTLEEAWHVMGSFSQYIHNISRRKQYIDDVKKHAINSLYDFMILYVNPRYLKDNEGLREEIDEVFYHYKNDNFNPADKTSKLFKYEDITEFKRKTNFWEVTTKGCAKELSTCEFWHKYACLFLKRYLAKVRWHSFYFYT